MITTRQDWINLASGTAFSPLAPVVTDIKLGDIAHGLSQICRFGGHCSVFYSVAQHSVIVSHIVEALGGSVDETRAALMHDAPEGLGLIDLPRPVKHHPALQAYRDAERVLANAVADRFHLSHLDGGIEPQIVTDVDGPICANERDVVFLAKNPAWTLEPLGGVAGKTFSQFLGQRRDALPPAAAEMQFCRRAIELFGEHAFAEFG